MGDEKILESQVLQVATQIENALDDEMDRIDNMEEDELNSIREKRVKQMKEMQRRKQEWLGRGHGTLNEIREPKEFFEWAKSSERMIVHFKRPATERCKIVDHHFSILAVKHFETRFATVDVEAVPGLAEHFRIMMLPTIMLIEGGKTFHSIIGFDDFGGKDDFETAKMETVFMHFGMINDRDMFAADQSTD